MKVPVTLKLAGLALGSTLFYTWVGQLVPQQVVYPPEVVEMSADLTTEDLVEIGRTIYDGKGLCATCHTIGRSGALRFPDLDGIALRASQRVPGMGQLEYLAESLYDPDAYIVPGFAGGMPQIDKPPIGLSDDEIKAVVAYLQTLGGEATVTMATRLPFAAGPEIGPVAEAEAAEPEAPAAAPAVAEAPPEAALPEAAPLLARYGCLDCHSAEPGGRLSLAGLGVAPGRLVIDIADHRPPLEATPAARMTLAEVRALADYLAGLEGER